MEMEHVLTRLLHQLTSKLKNIQTRMHRAVLICLKSFYIIHYFTLNMEPDQ